MNFRRWLYGSVECDHFYGQNVEREFAPFFLYLGLFYSFLCIQSHASELVAFCLYLCTHVSNVGHIEGFVRLLLLKVQYSIRPLQIS